MQDVTHVRAVQIQHEENGVEFATAFVSHECEWKSFCRGADSFASSANLRHFRKSQRQLSTAMLVDFQISSFFG